MKSHWLLRHLKTFNNNTAGDLAAHPVEVAVQLVEKGVGTKVCEMDPAIEVYDEAQGKLIPRAPATR